MLTVADYKLRMKHAIGNADPATGIVLLDVLNEALRELWTYHDWSWRARNATLVSLVADQGYCDLPADFGQGELLSVHSTSNPTCIVTKTSLSNIAALRGSVVQNYFHFYVALSWPTQVNASTPPAAARLEIWPTPASSLADAFRVVYRAGPTVMVNTSDVPNIPPVFENALTMLARGKIRQLELDGDMTDYNLAIPILDKLKEEDGMQEADVGPITGGAATLSGGRRRGTWRPFNPETDIPVH